MSNTNQLREIERKFLLKRLPAKLEAFPHAEIEQGYLAIERGVQVRLRKKGNDCFLACKRGNRHTREEREVRLSAEQFETLWPATEGRRLSKIRYDVPCGELVAEVDVYTGRHEGVIVVEVEFSDETSCERFVPPDWFGEEVTGQPRYSNIVMAQEEAPNESPPG